MSEPKKPSPQAKKRLLTLMVWAIVIVTVYIILRESGLYGVIDMLYILLALLFILCFYLSFAFAKRLPEKEELNASWDEVRKEKFLKRIRKNKELSIYFLYPMLPLMGVVAFDLIYRVFFAG